MKGACTDDMEEELQKALALSLGAAASQNDEDYKSEMERESKAAFHQSDLHMSLATASSPSPQSTQHDTSVVPHPSSGGGVTNDDYANMLLFEDEEDPELALALQYSLQDR